ncbi:hypothetical protein NDU88_001632 [Pleurodeles waltl]|uniref:Uncharacterized protein n=1 Tax=Pleurodeles waltl TaxID=8319 RepID=A0AAV7WLG3_PLEWA|nr:hypothetical protein NDU88_001632 [Pleurodeles waltl]
MRALRDRNQATFAQNLPGQGLFFYHLMIDKCLQLWLALHQSAKVFAAKGSCARKQYLVIVSVGDLQEKERFVEGAASFLGGRTRGPRATHPTPVVRDQRTGVQSAHLFGASIVTFISPGRGTPSQSRRLFSCGGLQITGPSPDAPCITRGSLARSGLLSRQAPVPGPGRACPNQAGEPPSQGSPSLGFSSVPRARCHRARVDEDQRSGPRRSTTRRGPQVTACSRHFMCRKRHSHQRRPRQRAGPDPRARRDAASPAAILGNLSIRSRPAFTARAASTPVPEGDPGPIKPAARLVNVCAMFTNTSLCTEMQRHAWTLRALSLIKTFAKCVSFCNRRKRTSSTVRLKS